MLYYIFRSDSNLVCWILPEEFPLTLQDDPGACFSRQMDFFGMLTPEDTRRFTDFCRSNPRKNRTASVPGLLLFPHTAYASVFAERYTSQRLSGSSPLPGELAAMLGQTPLHMLRERFPRNHLILTRLFRALSELYSATSPILAHVPAAVRSLLAELEQTRNTLPPICRTTPCLQAYYTEQQTTDAPTILDLYALLPGLLSSLSGNAMFSGLQLHFSPECFPVSPEERQIRFPLSAFLYIFVLLSYLMAVLSDRESVSISLHREAPYLCLTLFSETDHLPMLYHTSNELYSLTRHFPSCTGILTLLQYLLHRHYVSFICRSSTCQNWPGLEFTLYMDTRFREEIEFRHADVTARLEDTLPDALSLLRLLTTENDPDPPPNVI